MYQIIQGDCIEGMKTLPDESVHCVVTSPPYYGLRDYGTATWDGGNADCDHIPQFKHRSTRANDSQSGIGKYGYDGQNPIYKNICGKCGAVRVDQQIGLEDTPEAYVERLVNVFREVRRILRHDGTVWLNLGDSYTGGGAGRNDGNHRADGRAGGMSSKHTGVTHLRGNVGLKPKDLIGIPWRVAFALQADGWWLRQDIIWHKPNPMPESVTDRCTKSHEYIFLLTKSERYYYDAEAVKENAAGNSGFAKQRMSGNAFISKNKSEYIKDASSGHGYESFIDNGTRNKRSVWTIATQPYKEAHFAVFPPKLIEPCVLAGSPTNGVVFDPFTGSGTTAEVALKLGRSFIGTELNPEYVELIHKRLSKISISMFAD